jgi:hypothetical protein
MNKLPTVEQLADLAREAEIADPIDWNGLAINEATAYRMMASHVLEMYATAGTENRDAVMLSTITKLLVENFVLNVRLGTQQQ